MRTIYFGCLDEATPAERERQGVMNPGGKPTRLPDLNSLGFENLRLSEGKLIIDTGNGEEIAIRDEHVGQDAWVVFAAYEESEDGASKLDTIAITGKARFERARDEFFGGKEAKDYTSPVVENPTWLQLCELANEAIIVSRDADHRFLEGIEKAGDDGDVGVWHFQFGS